MPARAADAVSPQMRDRIRAKLDEIAREEDVLILYAAESGSRAWGFHSADSDYDVRFLYARPLDWHLSVRPGRDVIERPISDELDLSGWELKKALGLALGSNAVASEWLCSPIVYAEAQGCAEAQGFAEAQGGAEAKGFAEAMRAFCAQALRWRGVSWHYRRLAERQQAALREPDGSVKLKRYFYTLRPALALRWLRLHSGDGRPAAPPMNIRELLDQTDPGAEVRAFVEALIETKRAAGEMGTADATHEPTDALIAAELHAAAARLSASGEPPAPRPTQAADALHAEWTRRAEAALRSDRAPRRAPEAKER